MRHEESLGKNVDNLFIEVPFRAVLSELREEDGWLVGEEGKKELMMKASQFLHKAKFGVVERLNRDCFGNWAEERRNLHLIMEALPHLRSLNSAETYLLLRKYAWQVEALGKGALVNKNKREELTEFYSGIVRYFDSQARLPI